MTKEIQVKFESTFNFKKILAISVSNLRNSLLFWAWLISVGLIYVIVMTELNVFIGYNSITAFFAGFCMFHFARFLIEMVNNVKMANSDDLLERFVLNEDGMHVINIFSCSHFEWEGFGFVSEDQNSFRLFQKALKCSIVIEKEWLQGEKISLVREILERKIKGEI